MPIDDLNQFLKTLSTYVGRFKLAENRTSTFEFIKDKFGYQAEDIKVRSSLRMYIYSGKALILLSRLSGVVRFCRISQKLR
jgi:hypothetical protein